MRGEAWPEIRIGDIGEVFTGRTPPSDHPTYFGDDFPFITPGDMHQGKYVRATQRNLSPQGAAFLTRIKIPANSVCVSCIGWQMGEVIMTAHPSFTNQQINTIVPNGKVEPSFLYYSLLPRKQELLSLGSARGVRTPILNKSAFCDLKVKIPPLSAQRWITGILSAYDDLIENNTRRIKILEEMAQLIYREWFEFLRFPGHETAKSVRTGDDLIPEGWTFEEMQHVAEVTDCLHSKKPNHTEDGVGLMLQLFNIGEGGKLDLSEKYLISGADYKLWTSRIELSGGDCIITNVGRIAAVAQIPEGVKAAAGRNMTGIRARPDRLTPTFLLEYLLSPNMVNEVHRKKDAGTIMDSLNVKGIIRLRLLVSPLSTMKRFESVARPMRRLIEVLVAQNRSLRQTRDSLLPRLVSGEISLKQLEANTATQIS